jgi:hypothetical protein
MALDLDAVRGKLDSNQLAAVLENFYKKHMARQSEQQLKAA